jgi:hypothetical protein
LLLLRDNNFAEILLKLLNLLLKGFIPECFKVSYLILFKKANGKLLPINILPSFIRLASSFCCRTLNKVVADLDGNQFASSKGGAEVLSVSLRGFLQNKGNCIISLDFNNAFNSISRDLFLKALLHDAPSLYRFFYGLYSCDIMVVSSGNNVFTLSEGGAQGDPAMPALFSLALFHIARLAGPVPANIIVGKYLDDVSIGCSVESLPDAIHWYSNFVSVAAKYGLVINNSKTKLLTRSSVNAGMWLGGRVNLDCEVFDILGVPFCDDNDLLCRSLASLLIII